MAPAEGRSLYGAQRWQPLATGGKCSELEKGGDKPKPSPTVATSCRMERMVRNAMKKGLPRLAGSGLSAGSYPRGGPISMLHAGLDLSRRRLDFHLLDGGGETVELGAAPPDADGLRGLSARLARHG